MKPQDFRLGYFVVVSPSTNLFVGGMMVVDGRGLPIEFRYTEPIQPTRIQQILYGSSLTRYLKREVILKTLIKSISTTLDLLILEDETLLEGWNENDTHFPVIRLAESKNKSIGEIGEVEKVTNEEFLVQLMAQSNPLRLQFPSAPAYPGSSTKSLPDKSTGVEELKSTSVYQQLVEAAAFLDLVEPAQRVERALKELCQELGNRTPVA